MKTVGLVTLDAGLDRQLAWSGGDSVRYLVTTISAGKRERTREKRKPLNLAMVIDASGSMQGGALHAATESAVSIVEQLAAGDLFSVVSFADDVVRHAVAVKADSDARTRAIEAIRAIEVRGTTNLSGGWLEGAQCVAEVMSEGDGRQAHVVVLTDGNANQGVMDPETLGERAGKLLATGIRSSAIGIGQGYSTRQIEAIGTEGGGGMDHASEPGDIVEIVQGQLMDLRATACERLSVTVTVPPQVRVESLNAFAVQPHISGLDLHAGNIVEGGSRTLVFRLRFPAAPVNETMNIELKGSFSADGKDHEFDPIVMPIRFASGAENSPQPRDEARSLAAANAWLSGVIRESVRLNRERDYASAGEYLQGQLRFFEGYCEGIPGTEGLVAQVRHLYRRSGRDWGEGGRREMDIAAYKKSRFERDYRSRISARDRYAFPADRQSRGSTNP